MGKPNAITLRHSPQTELPGDLQIPESPHLTTYAVHDTSNHSTSVPEDMSMIAAPNIHKHQAENGPPPLLQTLWTQQRLPHMAPTQTTPLKMRCVETGYM